MLMEPQFITPDDFENYWGVNLREKLKNNSNPSNKANMFLKRIEIRVMNWIDANTFRVTRWDNLTEFQLEHFRIALLEQAMYVYRNTDLALDSAYDPEKGFIVQSNGSSSLKAIEICEPTLRELKLAGLYNLNILNRNRYTKILR